MSQFIQVVGAALVLVAFVGTQLHRLRSGGPAYLTLNFFGSAILAALALADHQWGFLLLEAVWCLVSFAGLLRLARRPRADRTSVGSRCPSTNPPAGD